MEKKYQSEISMIVHQDAEGMHQLGIIDDARMREFDKMCLIRKPDQAPKSTPRQAPAPTYTSPRRA
ncbi:MAG: XRE family transcriptional regulator [Treponema sp.]|nr:XRE family transcriptional regulator [Treponema sp.]